MSKRLIVQWGDTTLDYGDPEQVSITESGGTVKIEAGPRKGGGNLFDQLGSALAASSRQQTMQKRAELAADPAPAELADA